jgi:hypothetical protein
MFKTVWEDEIIKKLVMMNSQLPQKLRDIFSWIYTIYIINNVHILDSSQILIGIGEHKIIIKHNKSIVTVYQDNIYVCGLNTQDRRYTNISIIDYENLKFALSKLFIALDNFRYLREDTMESRYYAFKMERVLFEML